MTTYIESVCILALSAFLSWLFALLFIRRQRGEILFDSAIFAILTGAADFFLLSIGHPQSIVILQPLLFAVFSAIVHLQQQKNGCGNAVLALLLAQSSCGALICLGSFCRLLSFPAGIAVGALFIAVFLLLTHSLQRRFPQADWQDSYLNTMANDDWLTLKAWQVYAVTAIMCAASLAGVLFCRAADAAACGIMALLLFLIFWMGILLLILMNACKTDRVEALLEQQYRTEMQSFMNVIRSQRHDYNFHVQTLAGLIRSGDYEECGRYVDALEQDSQVMNAILPVKDPAVAAIINSFRLLAAREGIRMHIDIRNNLETIATNVYETNKIISNLLQNAIDETRTHKDRSYGIHLTVLKRGEYCVIRVSNALEGRTLDAEELNRQYRQGYSTKQGHEGVGLSSVRMLVTRYKGTVYTQTEGNIIHFVAKVPINYAKAAQEE